MERREFLRVRFDHEAHLTFAGKRWHCIIRDFCPGGVLIEFPLSSMPVEKGNGALMAGEVVLIELILKLENKSAKINFHGEVRHRVVESLGLRFESINPERLALLKQATEYERQQHTKDVSQAQIHEVKIDTGIIENFRENLLEQLPLVLERAIKQAENRLQMSANEASDSWLRSDFHLSSQILDRKCNGIAGGISKKLAAALQGVAQTGSLPAKHEEGPSSPSLAIVEKDDFEDWLALKMATKEVEDELGHDLSRLCYVFERMTGKPVDVEDCPVGPAAILSIFHEAGVSLDLPGASQPLIYKVLGQVLKKELKALYGNMISVAERRGIKGYSSRKQPQNITREGATGGGNIADPGVDSGLAQHTDLAEKGFVANHASSMQGSEALGHVSSNAEGISGGIRADSSLAGTREPMAAKNTTKGTLSTLQSLIGLGTSVLGGRQNTPVATNVLNNTVQTAVNEDSGQFYELAQIVGAVASLQDKQPGESTKTGLKHGILSVLEGKVNEPLDMRLRDAELIDTTDRLFETILSQIGVSDVVKSWLKKLRLSILKVILLDRSFFSNPLHPARQIINQLARLGATKRSSGRMLDSTIDAVNHKIMNEYVGDNHLFEDILAHLNQLVERQEQAFKRNAERIARTYDGQQKLTDARHKVVADINALIVDHKMPRVILSLIDKAGWGQLMVVTLLREGADTGTYHDYLHVLDQLMGWLADGVDDGDETAKFEREIEAPTLVSMIERELLANGQTGFKPVLARLYSELLDGKSSRMVRLDAYQWPIDENMIPALDESAQMPKKPGKWHKRAQQLKIGDWIEMTNDKEERQRMRLAWSGSRSFRFVFVDSQGLKDIDMNINELAGHLQKGTISLLQHHEVPLVDQGLHHMVQSVYDDMASQANCDHLTGLLSRQAFERALERSVTDCVTNNSEHVICYVDLDQFKVINNTYGHIAGDSLLKHVATIIRQHASSLSTCGRIGGNEFGIIFDRTPLEDVKDVADSIRKTIAETEFSWQGISIRFTASIGLARIERQTDNHDAVMRKASIACTASKEHGCNRVTLYESQDRDQARHDEMIAWVKRMDAGLDDILFLRCQEIRPIANYPEKLSHYEILLGVYDEQNNVVPPVAFIEAAERFGRMPRVDRWVIHNVLRWLEKNPGVFDLVDGFSINLSGTSINDEQFLSFVMGELTATSVPKEKIAFEVTETAAVASLSDAADFVTTLKKTGVKFSLDDFGTGLSSYAYIQKLPVDIIKIDGVFVRNIINNHKDRALVKSITELGHFMDMDVIAEFVENEESLGVLRELGVDKAQGYGIARPFPLVNLLQTVSK